MHLSQIWPQSKAFDDLVAAVSPGQPISPEHSRQLATRLLHCYTSGLVEFSLCRRGLSRTSQIDQWPAPMRGSA